MLLSLNVGGAERLVEQMLRRAPEGFSVSAIALDSIGLIGQSLAKDGIPVTLIQRVPGVDLALPFKIAKHLRRKRIDILHCHQYSAWFYGVLAKALYPKVRIIFTEHGRFHPDLPKLNRRVFNRVFNPITAGITSVSPATLDALVRVEGFPRKKIKLIYNGVDGSSLIIPEDKAEARIKLGLLPGRHYFLLCARFNKVKWIEGLIGAFGRLAGRRENVGLIVVGDGDLRPGFEVLIRELGLEDKVMLPGYRSDIPLWLKAADAFVLSSHSEGTSVSLIEAMASGLPQVATAVGGNVHIVEDGGTGLLVPARDEEALAAGLMRLVDDPEFALRLGEAARERFDRLFRLSTMLENYEQLYRALAGRERSG